MTKAELILAVHGVLQEEPMLAATDVVDIVLETIKEELEAGQDVMISGFGKFHVRDKHARHGRNPQTGEEIALSARRVVTFKPSGVLRATMNGEG